MEKTCLTLESLTIDSESHLAGILEQLEGFEISNVLTVFCHECRCCHQGADFRFQRPGKASYAYLCQKQGWSVCVDEEMVSTGLSPAEGEDLVLHWVYKKIAPLSEAARVTARSFCGKFQSLASAIFDQRICICKLRHYPDFGAGA